MQYILNVVTVTFSSSTELEDHLHSHTKHTFSDSPFVNSIHTQIPSNWIWQTWTVPTRMLRGHGFLGEKLHTHILYNTFVQRWNPNKWCFVTVTTFLSLWKSKRHKRIKNIKLLDFFFLFSFFYSTTPFWQPFVKSLVTFQRWASLKRECSRATWPSGTPSTPPRSLIWWSPLATDGASQCHTPPFVSDARWLFCSSSCREKGTTGYKRGCEVPNHVMLDSYSHLQRFN